MNTLATGNFALELTLPWERVCCVIPFIGAETCPIGDHLALVQVAAVLDYWK